MTTESKEAASEKAAVDACPYCNAPRKGEHAVYFRCETYDWGEALARLGKPRYTQSWCCTRLALLRDVAEKAEAYREAECRLSGYLDWQATQHKIATREANAARAALDASITNAKEKGAM